MPEFINHNRHRVYVQNPGVGIVRIIPGEEVSATGAFADNLEDTAGVFKKGTKEEKERAKEVETIAESLAAPGPKAFPANEPEYEDSEGKSIKEVGQADDNSGKGGTVTSDKVPGKSAAKKPAAKKTSSGSKSS